MATELGAAYLSVIPDMSQLGKNVTKGVTKVFADTGKEAGEAMARSALAAAKSDIAKLAKTVAAATDKQSDAVGRLRVAEARLAEIRQDTKAKVSAIAAAEESVAIARRKATQATDAQKTASERLAKAQEKERTSAANLEKVQADGAKTGNRFTNGFKSAFSPKAISEKIRQLPAGNDGKQVATRFGVGFNGMIGGIVSRSAGIFAAGFAAVQSVRVFGGFIADAKESQRVGKLTEAVIKSTGGAAKISAEGVGELATAISNKTGMDDEAIQSGANLLLTFKNVRNEAGKNNDIFNRATAAAADLSAAGFGDLTSTSKQLGKALNDPLKGISALSRSGVTFTAQQKKQIETLVESGNVLAAQKVILKEVESQVGGAAAAVASPLDRLKVIAGNLGEQFGGFLLPKVEQFATFLGSKVAPAVSGLATLIIKGDFTGQLAKAFGIDEDNRFIGFIIDARNALAGLFQTISSSGAVQSTISRMFGLVRTVLGEAVGSIYAFTAAWKANDGDITSSGVPGFFERLGFYARQLGEFLTNDVVPAIGKFAGFLRDNETVVKAVVVGVGAMVAAYKVYQFTLVAAATVGRAFAVVQAIINAVMSANVFAIVVLAVIGLVAGLIYAYKHSEKFRSIVNGAFNAVKGVVVTVIGAIKTAIGALVTAFHAVTGAIGSVIDFVKNNWKLILPLILGPVIGIPLAIALHWGTIKKVFMAGVNAVLDALGTAWGAIVGVVSGPLNTIIGFLNAVWSRIYPIIVLPLYIAKTLIGNTLSAIQDLFTAVKDWVTKTWSKAWNAVSGTLSGPIDTAKTWIGNRITDIQNAFTAVKDWAIGTFKKAWSAVSGVFTGAVDSAKTGIDTKIADIKGLFTTVKDWAITTFAKAWGAVTEKLTGPINTAKSAIDTVLGAGKNGLQTTFTNAVAGIGRIWDGLQELAKRPIRFIVGTVLNDGLIGAFNWVASKFQAPTIPTIPLPKGFASGGEFSGRLPGRPSAVDNMIGMSAAGPVGLATGEFIVNAKQTARNLPLLRAINDGTPGFADGGLFGKLKGVASKAFTAGKSFGSDVLDVLSDPVKWFKERLSGPLNRLSELGNSPMAEIVKAVPRSIVNTVTSKAKELLGLGGDGSGPVNAGLAGVLQWMRGQVGKPYIWGGVGPAGYDCSGLVSAAINVALGRNPYQRLGATGSMPWGMFAPGPGAFQVGWFKGNPGHTAATVNGVNIESRGGRGVLMGPEARGASNGLFTNRMHVRGFADGGLFGDPPFDLLSRRGKAYVGADVLPRVPVFDSGGTLVPGYNLVNNLTGEDEELRPVDRDRPLVLHVYDTDKGFMFTMRGVAREEQVATASRLTHQFQLDR